MFNYNNTFKLMKNYKEKLNINETRIIDYLIDYDYVELSYTELTICLGLDKNIYTSNVRKAILHLEELGIVCIVRKETKEPGKTSRSMRACYLVDDWMKNLLNMEENEKSHTKISVEQLSEKKRIKKRNSKERNKERIKEYQHRYYMEVTKKKREEERNTI